MVGPLTMGFVVGPGERESLLAKRAKLKRVRRLHLHKLTSSDQKILPSQFLARLCNLKLAL